MTTKTQDIAELKRLLWSDSATLVKIAARNLARSGEDDAIVAIRRRLLDPKTPTDLLGGIASCLAGDFEVDSRLTSHLFQLWRRSGHPMIARLLENGVQHIDPVTLVPSLLKDETYHAGLRLLVLTKAPIIFEGACESLLAPSDDSPFSLLEFAQVGHQGVPGFLLRLLMLRRCKSKEINASDFCEAFAARIPHASALRGLYELSQTEKYDDRIVALTALTRAGFGSERNLAGLIAQLQPTTDFVEVTPSKPSDMSTVPDGKVH